MGDIKYLTGSAYGEGGAIVLQEACISRGNTEQTQIIMAIVFAEHNEQQHKLAVEAGEWFQNQLVSYIKNKGTERLIDVCIEGIGGRKLSEKLNSTEFVCAIFAGDEAVLFKNGSEAGIYSMEELFGKAVALPMEPGNGGIMVGVDVGGALVLTDSNMTGDKFFADQIAAGMSAVTDETGLEKLLGEIVSIDDIACKSIVGIRFSH